jgi:hypothetical protein
MLLIFISTKITIEAKQNLTPAEKIGVSDSNPMRIAIHVEPQIKHITAYASKTLTANLFTMYLSLQLLPVPSPISVHLSDMSVKWFRTHMSII